MGDFFDDFGIEDEFDPVFDVAELHSEREEPRSPVETDFEVQRDMRPLLNGSGRSLWREVHHLLATDPRRAVVDSIVCMLGEPAEHGLELLPVDWHALSFVVHAFVGSVGGPSLARLDRDLGVPLGGIPFIAESPEGLLEAASTYADAAVAAVAEQARQREERCAAAQASFKARALAEQHATLASRHRRERQKAHKRSARSRSGAPVAAGAGGAAGDLSGPSSTLPPTKMAKALADPASARPAMRARPEELAPAAEASPRQRPRLG